MIVLLTFLIRYCPWILNTPGFRFKDSAVGPHPAAGSWILLESDHVQIYLCNEKNLITLEIRSLHDPKRKNWFSFDLLARLLGHEVATGVMDNANSELLSTHLDGMIMLFEHKQVTATLAKLNALKAERARRI